MKLSRQQTEWLIAVHHLLGIKLLQRKYLGTASQAGQMWGGGSWVWTSGVGGGGVVSGAVRYEGVVWVGNGSCGVRWGLCGQV